MYRYIFYWENEMDEYSWKLVDLKRPFFTEGDLRYVQNLIEKDGFEDVVIINFEYIGLVEQPVVPDEPNIIFRYFVSWKDEDMQIGNELIDLNRMAHTQDDFDEIERLLNKYADTPTLRSVKFINKFTAA